jgi:hypothetical protein
MLVDAGQQLPLSQGLSYERDHSPGAGPDLTERLAQSSVWSSGEKR